MERLYTLLRTFIIVAVCSCAFQQMKAQCLVTYTTANYFCDLDSLWLTAVPLEGTGPFSFIWETGETTQTIMIPLAYGDYMVTMTDATGCTHIINCHVKPYPPVLYYPYSQDACEGDTVTLFLEWFRDSLPGATYEWSTGETTPTIQLTDDLVWSVTITDPATGCTFEIPPGLFDFHETPEPEIVGPTEICEGQTIVLSVEGGPFGSTVWYVGDEWWGVWDPTITITEPAQVIVWASSPTASYCWKQDTVNITLGEIPPPLLAGPPDLCEFQSDIIEVTNADLYEQFMWSNGETGSSFTATEPGIYTVTVTEESGCTSTASIEVEDALENELTVDPFAATCGQTNGGINLSYSLSGSYDFLWSTGATTQNLADVPSGTYSVTVTDPEGCSATIESEVPEEEVDIVINDNITHNTSCDDYNGAVNITVLPAEIYTYQWSNGATTEDISGLFPGIYTVTVTTGNTCTAVTDFLIEDLSAAPEIFTSLIPATCGETNGAIDVTLVDGTEPFVFIWSNGAETQSINEVPAGDYGVTVTAADGCVSIENVFLPNDNPPITIDAAIQPNTSCNGANGSIDITASPEDNYDYNWSTGSSDEDLTGLGEGTYIVTVTLGAACSQIDTFVVTNESLPFEISGSQNDNTSCSSPNGGINVSITPSGTYTYSWSNGATSEDLQNIGAGNYTLTVTNTDGCAISTSFTIANLNSNFTLAGTSINNTSCMIPNGIVDISVTPSGTYSYQWSTGAITEDLSGVGAGSYQVTVSDANGCTASSSFTVADQTTIFTLTASPTENNSCTTPDGSLDLTITPSGSYSFLWSNGATTEDIHFLPGGFYTVTVTDANSCSSSAQFSIQSNTTDPVITSIVTNEVCSSSNGSIDLNTTPAGNLFQWSNGATSEDLSDLSSGLYIVTVTSPNGCTSVDTFSIVNTSNNFTLAASPSDNNSCTNPNGSIDITITPVGVYSFVWSNGSTGEDLINLDAGTYTVTVTDNLGCSSTSSFAIGSTTPAPVIQESITAASCGNANGSIQLNVTPASGNTFTWSDGSTVEDLQNLSPGNYTITVTAANGCSSTATFTVPDNNSNFTVNGSFTDNTSCISSNGSIDINITPSGSYTYSWSNGLTTPDLLNLSSGNYQLTVTDQFNCSSTISFTIGESTVTPVLNPIVTPATCGQNNGSVDLSVSLTINNTFLWSDGSTSEDLSSMLPGTYQVTVTGDNGCSSIASVDIPNQNTNFTVSSNIVHDASCTLPSGSIDLVVLPIGNYTYQWSGGETSEDLTDLSSGIYTVTVSDQFNCSTSEMFIIEDITSIPLVSEAVTIESCGQSNGRIDLTVTPNAGMNFLWSTGDVSEDLENIKAGNYSVTVTDQNGCSIRGDYSVPGSTMPELSLFADLNSVAIGDDVICSLQVNIPSSAIQNISWFPLDIMSCQDPICFEQTIALLQQTEIQVMVMDTDGCMGTANLLLTVEEEIKVYIPNVFTPSIDGPNSKFTVYANEEVEEVVELEIFDRWGDCVFINKLFPPNEPNYGWDGVYGGKTMNPAVYAYRAVVRYSNGEYHAFKGDVTLVR